MKKVFLDFEFNGIRERKMNIVCCALHVTDGKWSTVNTHWTHKDKLGASNLREELLTHQKDGAIFFAYMASAEARSMISLDLDPLKNKWIDLSLEYRCLTNHNHELGYGKQLIDGKERDTTPPRPKWYMSEEELRSTNMSKPQHSLAACTYKILGKKIDTDRKNKMRDLIISTPKYFSDSEREEILEYCVSDVENMNEIFSMMLRHYKKRLPEQEYKKLPKEMFLRGEYAARTALMETIGYPVNKIWVSRFTEALPSIIENLQKDINSQFSIKPFKWNKKDDRFSLDTKVIKGWLKNNVNTKKWLKTNGGDLSLSHDAFEDNFHFRHEFPRKNFGAQMLRFFKFKQSLNGFLPKSEAAKNKEVFLDYVGSDGFCRPYFGIYGSQSSRSQPKATSFIPLKSAWMRSFIQPPKGKVIFGIDYSSQEFLLNGLISRDKVMIDAYRSGDPYIYLAIAVGAAPEGATKKSHPKIRDPFKSTELGVGYGMMGESLANKLTQDTGVFHSVEDAEILINHRMTTYWKNTEWRDLNLDEYKEKGFLKLPCGWYMWGDNNNDRSVNNFPAQGLGASILRKAVSIAQDKGVQIVYTLHDAVYAMSDLKDSKKNVDLLWDSMHEAFIFYFEGAAKKYAELIRLEGDIWGPDLTEGEFKSLKGRILKQQKIYVDDRGRKEYETFSKYFNKEKLK